MTSGTHANLREYYGQILQQSSDLQTNACCTDGASIAADVKEAMKRIHPEILARFYGCGSPIPAVLEGCTVLDLGCGTGRDAYILAQLVGDKGRVIGVDMTDEQLSLARKHQEYHMDCFSYAEANVDFRKGFIEDLAEIGIEDNSIDVVVSNCVINLSPDKESVFREIFRVLKPGGELYFSDVFADRRIPRALRDNPVLHGECLSGSLYIEDFRRLLTRVGCPDYRVMSQSVITIDNPELEALIGMVGFNSVTVRAFNLPLEDLCEDYGQTAVYLGSVPGHPHYFKLDDHHCLYTGKPMLVCGNTAAMLADTRLARHFRVSGDTSVHYGPFDCSPVPPGQEDSHVGSCC